MRTRLNSVWQTVSEVAHHGADSVIEGVIDTKKVVTESIAPIVRDYILNPYFLMGRVIASAGSSLFFMPDVNNYITEENLVPEEEPKEEGCVFDENWMLYASAFVITASVLATLGTQAVFYRPKGKKTNSENVASASITRGDDTDNTNKNAPQQLGKVGKGISYTLEFVGGFGAAWAAFNNYFSSFYLINSFDTCLLGNEDNDAAWKHVVAVSFASAKYYNFFKYRWHTHKKNVEYFASYVEHAQLPPWDKKAVIKTFAPTMIATAVTGTFANFSTEKSVAMFDEKVLQKLFSLSLSTNIQNNFVNSSSSTAVVSYLFQDVPALYNRFKQHPNNSAPKQDRPPLPYENYIKFMLRVSIGSDNISTAVGYFMGNIEAWKKITGTEVSFKNVLVNSVALGAASLLTFFSVVFSDKQADDVIEEFKDWRDERAQKKAAVATAPTPADIENGSAATEKTSLLGGRPSGSFSRAFYGSNSSLLFQQPKPSSSNDAIITADVSQPNTPGSL